MLCAGLGVEAKAYWIKGCDAVRCYLQRALNTRLQTATMVSPLLEPEKILSPSV